MQLNSLNNKTAQRVPKADQPKTVVMRLQAITPSADGPTFFHGFHAGSDEPVSVRLMDVDEALAVVGSKFAADRDAARAKLVDLFGGKGEKRRPRPSEFANPEHKVHCEPQGLMVFTRCLKNEDGSYRAYWPETLAASAGVACDRVHANIVLDRRWNETAKRVQETVAADIVMPESAVVLNAENVKPTLLGAMSPSVVINGEPVGRRPFVFLRLISKEDGSMPLAPARVHAAYVPTTKKDHDTGLEITRHDAAPAEQSLAKILTPADKDERITQDALVARAMIFALGDKPGYPDFSDADERVVGDLKQIVDAVRSGDYVVEAIPGERIAAGPATRASLLKQGFTGDDPKAAYKANHPVHMFWSPRDEKGYIKERRFLPTYLTTEIGKDGLRFFTKNVLEDYNPGKVTIKTLATVNDFKTGAGAAKERVADAELTEADGTGFDPSSIDEAAERTADGKLAQAAAALDIDEPGM
ncbi:hypothetical protein [Cupriavidus sp. TMH.W2]|uniref:hypothetical protein n=1 Tax=Cupriavidus sp. TMH.W2 TaxID=3434465 RepID=UPI003D76F9E0